MRNFLILMTMFILSGCWLSVDKPDRIDHYSTTFFNKVYLYNKFSYEITPEAFSDIVRPFNEFRSDTEISFYQNSKKECYLFSKSNKELSDLENLFFKSNKDKIPIFLIEKDDVRIVSMEEFERIKPTLKPHPYDPSLCKPKPKELEDK